MYEDITKLKQHVNIAAWRRGSMEVSKSSAEYLGLRRFVRGNWVIASSSSEADLSRLKELVHSLSRNITCCTSSELEEADFCSGVSSVGEEVDLSELVSIVREIAALLGGAGEVIATSTYIERSIESSEFSCTEFKGVSELSIFAEEKSYGKYAVASFSIAVTGNLRSVMSVIEEVVEDLSFRAASQLRAKALSPLNVGKWVLVLDYELAGALFHELAHLLEGDRGEHLIPGQDLGVKWLNVSDDPLATLSPASTSFDDEGVRSKRKYLIVNGVVTELLHTRSSAFRFKKAGFKATPGQARGLFHVPKAMHSTLTIAPGDWRLREIIEETKKGLYAKGLIRAELRGGLVTIIPENVWIINRGEVGDPIFVRQIKIPLIKGLRSVDAVSRDVKLRYSYEKGHVVAEVAPAVRMLGYVE